MTAYGENGWARALGYAEQDADEALELFRLLRGRTYQLIRSLPGAVWANTIMHPENGAMTLDDWLDVYARHVSDHVAQMQTVYAAWRAQPG